MNDDLRDKKEFRNPGILELLMDKYSIRETGYVASGDWDDVMAIGLMLGRPGA